MNKFLPLISICIPTYNGARTIEKTLNAIISQVSNDFEIILSDDASTDNTLEIVKKIQSNFNSIKLFHNKENLGMDGNFHQTTQLARGRYIWFCGQDDILCDGVLQQVLRMIKNNKDIGIINLNFSQYDHDMINCLMESFFEIRTFDQNLVKENKELYFNTPEEYYKIFTQPPSFLPSVVMLREYWTTSDVKQFYGTYFIQVGVLLLNMHKNRIGVFTVPLIRGCIPDDQWQQDGNKLFLIMTGDLAAKKIAFDINQNLPYEIYNRDRIKYLLNYIFLVYQCKVSGLESSPDNVIKLKKIFEGSFYMYVYVILVFHMPTIVLRMIVFPGKYIKKLIFRTKVSDIRR
jgi:glycosyltransferase involved in cell wall biosynthesis